MQLTAWKKKKKSSTWTVTNYKLHHHSLLLDLDEIILQTVSNVFLKSLSWQNRAHHFENFTCFFFFHITCSMCVTSQSKVQKVFFPTHSSLPSAFVHFFSHTELLFIVIQILINIIIICSIINTKKVKAGNLAEKNRHSAGREGVYGLTIGTSLTSTCYQQATKRMESQLWNRTYCCHWTVSCCFRRLEHSRGWWEMSSGARQLEAASVASVLHIFTLREEEGG